MTPTVVCPPGFPHDHRVPALSAQNLPDKALLGVKRGLQMAALGKEGLPPVQTLPQGIQSGRKAGESGSRPPERVA